MTTCELIGCKGFVVDHCQWKDLLQCPPRKAEADGLVEALKEIIKHDGCGIDCDTCGCSCEVELQDIASAALAKLQPKEGDNT